MATTPVSNPSAKTTLDAYEGSAISALYRAAIGPVNTDYYLPVFERFEAAGRAGPSWNSAACLSTFNWMVFRHLWGAALLYAAALGGATLLTLGLGRLALGFSDTTELCLLVALGTVALLAPGVWGNALVHRRLRKAMEAALAATATVTEACVLLNRQASTRQRIVGLALANAALAGAVLGVYVAWPHAQRPAAVAGRVLKPALAVLAAPAASAPAKAASAAAASAAAPLPAPVPMPAPVVAASRSTPTPTPATPTPATPTPTPTIKASSTSSSEKYFYINVGLFANDDNARKAHARLLEAGLAAFTEELATANGKRTRVRVGPFDSKTAADKAADKIRDLKLEAVVFRQ